MTDRAAIFDEIVAARHSLRAFLPQAVDPDILATIFAVAQRAPSNCNSQPWITHVVSGEKLEMLRSEMPQRFIAGNISMDFPYDGVYHGVYKERQYGAAQALYSAVKLAREDKAGRNVQFMRNFTFFDAPHVAFLFLPEPFGLREAADLGMYAQTLMLTLTAHGLVVARRPRSVFRRALCASNSVWTPVINCCSACPLVIRIGMPLPIPVGQIAPQAPMR